jgi:GTP-binding protein
VLTKADDVPPAQFAKRLTEVEGLARRHIAAHPMVLVTSSETGQGIPELRAELSAFAVPG